MLSACAEGIDTAAAASRAMAEKTRMRATRGLRNVVLLGCWDIYRLNGICHQSAIPVGIHFLGYRGWHASFAIDCDLKMKGVGSSTALGRALPYFTVECFCLGRIQGFLDKLVVRNYRSASFCDRE